MTKGLLVSVAVLALSTSAALAAHHHRHVITNATVAEPSPALGWMGPISSSDHAMHLQNLRDSGYNPKNDYNAAGNVAD
jgi:hypothetical protein